MKRIISLLVAAAAVLSLFAVPVSARTTLRVSVSRLTLEVGDVIGLRTQTNSKDAIVWRTSNSNIVTVHNGWVTARNEGRALIRASVGGVNRDIAVTVRNAQGISLPAPPVTPVPPIATLPAPVIPPGLSDANVQYIRANFTENINSPSVSLINSREELRRHVVTDKYTENFFRDNYLVLIRITETSGSIRHTVEEVKANGEIVISRLVPEIGTDDIAQWIILIERGRERSFIPNYRVVFTDIPVEVSVLYQ